jgi:hypothetical protein
VVATCNMLPVQFLSQKRRTLTAPHVSHTTCEERCAHNTLSSAEQSWNSFSANSCASSCRDHATASGF